jgi:hypothetical protein
MDSARRVYRLVSSSIERHRRDKVVISTGTAPSDRPTVYFLTPDFDRPSGGIRVIYRHVDILNAAGIPAAVLHQEAKFRATWFPNQTRIANLSDTIVKRGDLLVVGELDVDIGSRLPAGTRHVVFNQNAHMTWVRSGEEVTPAYYDKPDLLGAVVVSHHNEQIVQYAFPRLAVHRIHLSIDPVVFRLGDAPRERTLCYMPRRGGGDARSVLAMLESRGLLRGWTVRALDNLSEQEVGEQLRNTCIFLSLSHHEGFGLPPAEAMACGAFVVGYHGFSGREFLLPEFSSPVEPGDILTFARMVEAALWQESVNPGWCQEKGRQASAFIRQACSPDREREDVRDLYAHLLSRVSPGREHAAQA